jgi:tight adherence protein B
MLYDRDLMFVGIGVAGVFLVVYFLARALFARRGSKVQKRLRGSGSGFGSGSASASFDNVFKPRSLMGTGEQGWATRFDKKFDRMIVRTGTELTSQEALGLICLIGSVLGALSYLYRGEILHGIFGGALGAGGTYAVFRILQARFRRRIQEALPDAVYMLARALKAGLTIEQSLAQVGDQPMPPLAGEFKRCAAQIRLGLAPGVALQILADRVQLPDMSALASTVTMAHTTGGNLPLILDRLASSARDHNQFRGHMHSVTAQGRATAICMGLAGPALLIGYAFWQPDYIQRFIEHPASWPIIGGCLVIEAIAVVMLYQILKIEY